MSEHVTDSDLLRVARSSRGERPLGGARCIVSRRSDGRMIAMREHSGHPLGYLVTEDELELITAARRDDADPLSAFRGVIAGGVLGLLSLVVLYAVWHHGRWYERSAIAPDRTATARFSSP